MKILVLGSHSDLGKQVVDYLLANGHEVVGFDRMKLPDDYPVYSDGEKPKCVRFLGDIRDFAAVSEGVSVCDGVIHLASIADSEATDDNPGPAIEFNLLGTLNVLNACRQHVKRAVYVVPDSEYSAEGLVFRYNRKHGTECAVVKLTDRVATEEEIGKLYQVTLRGVPAGIVDNVINEEFFTYDEPIHLVEKKLEVVTV